MCWLEEWRARPAVCVAAGVPCRSEILRTRRLAVPAASRSFPCFRLIVGKGGASLPRSESHGATLSPQLPPWMFFRWTAARRFRRVRLPFGHLGVKLRRPLPTSTRGHQHRARRPNLASNYPDCCDALSSPRLTTSCSGREVRSGSRCAVNGHEWNGP